jgi:hypothetical protein
VFTGLASIPFYCIFLIYKGVGLGTTLIIGVFTAAVLLLVSILVWRRANRASRAMKTSQTVLAAEPATPGTVQAYKKKMIPGMAATGAFLLIAGWVLSFTGHHRVILITSIVAVLVGVPLALEFRRTITLSEHMFEYKWRSGEVVRINVADIEAIEEATTPYMLFIGRPFVVPGLRVVLKSGVVRIFPVDFPDRVAIVARLRAMASSRAPKT